MLEMTRAQPCENANTVPRSSRLMGSVMGQPSREFQTREVFVVLDKIRVLFKEKATEEIGASWHSTAVENTLVSHCVSVLFAPISGSCTSSYARIHACVGTPLPLRLRESVERYMWGVLRKVARAEVVVTQSSAYWMDSRTSSATSYLSICAHLVIGLNVTVFNTHNLAQHIVVK